MQYGMAAAIGAAAFVAGALATFVGLGLGPEPAPVAGVEVALPPPPDPTPAQRLEEQHSPGSGVAAAPQEEDPDNPVVAVVGSRVLRLSDLDAFKQFMPQQFRDLPTRMIYDPLLEQAINGVLLADAGRRAGLHESPELRARVAFIEDRLVQDAYVDRLAREASETLATDEEIRRRYELFLTESQAEDEVHGRHIVLRSREDADAVIKELDRGADFIELAKKKSTGPSAGRGGDLGYFTRGEMVPAFAEAAFKLKKGDYTRAPVKTEFGWHVISVVDRRRRPPPTFEEKREDLIEQIAREHVLASIDKLRSDMVIERFDLNGLRLTSSRDEGSTEGEPGAGEADVPPPSWSGDIAD